ncbi:MAG: hypothetical protein SGI96_21135 [Bacteroidota bacterium]|nr:hypothetical protein [Bacteroidota bacterium]
MASLNTESISALNASVAARPLDNFGTAGIIISGTWVGTISFEGSLDGINFVSIFAMRLSDSFFLISAASNGQFLINVSGMVAIRAKLTAYTSGTADIVIQGNAAVSINRALSTIVGATDGTQIGNDSNALKGFISGRDSLSVLRSVQTKVRGDGLTALVTDASGVVESTLGFDQQPDSFFQIINTGAAGNTWTIFIAGTSADPTGPDRDLPDYTKVFTVLAGEVGDELKLRDRIVQELNSDPVFKSTVFLKAAKATDRAIVHIQSQKFSVSGDFYERPFSGNFNVTVTGTAVRIVGFDNLISRSKPVTISRDRDSPHRLGLFGVTGSVSVTAKELSGLFVAEATNAGSSDMRVNGSLASPIDFLVPASTTTDIFIQDLIFDAGGNGMKFGKFLSKSSAIVNGVEVQIKSDDIITTFQPIFTNEEFKNKWAALSGSGAAFRIDVQDGEDELLAILHLDNPFILRVAGSFTTDDFIRVRIRDNLSSQIARFNFRAKGFEKEP